MVQWSFLIGVLELPYYFRIIYLCISQSWHEWDLRGAQTLGISETSLSFPVQPTLQFEDGSETWYVYLAASTGSNDQVSLCKTFHIYDFFEGKVETCSWFWSWWRTESSPQLECVNLVLEAFVKYNRAHIHRTSTIMQVTMLRTLNGWLCSSLRYPLGKVDALPHL